MEHLERLTWRERSKEYRIWWLLIFVKPPMLWRWKHRVKSEDTGVSMLRYTSRYIRPQVYELTWRRRRISAKAVTDVQHIYPLCVWRELRDMWHPLS